MGPKHRIKKIYFHVYALLLFYFIFIFMNYTCNYTVADW